MLEVAARCWQVVGGVRACVLQRPGPVLALPLHAAGRMHWPRDGLFPNLDHVCRPSAASAAADAVAASRTAAAITFTAVAVDTAAAAGSFTAAAATTAAPLASVFPLHSGRALHT